MGLPARQMRVLGRIETGLLHSDPKLAALYAMFARLNREEEMPRAEQVRHRVLIFLLRLRLALSSISIRPPGLIARQPAILFLPLAVAVLTAGIVLAVHAHPGDDCTWPSPAAAAARHHSGASLCRSPTPVTPLTYGK